MTWEHSKKTAIVGIGATPYCVRGQSWPRTINEMIGEAIPNVCADAGLSVKQIEGFAYYGQRDGRLHRQNGHGRHHGYARRPRGERATLDYLALHGVPVIPARTVTSAATAITAARELSSDPVVLKIASADVPHKTEAGGVLLDLRGDDAVAEGYRRIVDNVRRAVPQARVDDVIVSPMRPRGTELFVGVARDPQSGLVLAVTMGGVWVEILQDSSLRLLPVDRAEAATMFRELTAARILQGYRGQPAVNIEVPQAARRGMTGSAQA